MSPPERIRSWRSCVADFSRRSCTCNFICRKRRRVRPFARDVLPSHCIGARMRGGLCRTSLAPHLKSAVWDWTDAEDKINANGRQWARVTLKDASGQVTLFASEEALLQMTHCHDKDEFMKAFKQDVLPRHRIHGRVHRSIKVEQSRTYANMVLMEAASMFTIPPEIGVDAAERHRSCLFIFSE